MKLNDFYPESQKIRSPEFDYSRVRRMSRFLGCLFMSGCFGSGSHESV